MYSGSYQQKRELVSTLCAQQRTQSQEARHIFTFRAGHRNQRHTMDERSSRASKKRKIANSSHTVLISEVVEPATELGPSAGGSLLPGSPEALITPCVFWTKERRAGLLSSCYSSGHVRTMPKYSNAGSSTRSALHRACV